MHTLAMSQVIQSMRKTGKRKGAMGEGLSSEVGIEFLELMRL